jgi:hypothetical protein
MIETQVDGWNCQRVRTDTLNLIDDTLDTVVVYADTVWCTLREAGVAFDEADYGTSAELYREVISKFDGQMAQYLDARLALAYALGGQVDAAQATLNRVDIDGQMGDLILRLQAVSDQPQAMCRAAYDFFAQTNRREDVWENPYEWTPENFHFGREPDDPRYFPLPMPSQAGCDYQQTIESVYPHKTIPCLIRAILCVTALIFACYTASITMRWRKLIRYLRRQKRRTMRFNSLTGAR